MKNNGTKNDNQVGLLAYPESASRVIVEDDVIRMVDFTERDPDTVAYIGNADDPVEATHQCLRIGTQAVRAAHASLDADIVRERFDTMSDHFDNQVDTAVDQIVEATQSLLDEENGALPIVLGAHHQQLDDLLGATFDPESKKSVMAVFEQVMANAHEQQLATVRRLISVDSEDSPLRKMKGDIVKEVGRRLSEIRGEVQELSEKIAVKAAVAPVFATTSAKGFAYEEVVHEQVSAIAATHGDTAEDVGKTVGSKGSKKGDEVVTVNRDDTYGQDGRFVIEAKSRKLNMRSTQKELDGALENRDAQAAVAVFSSQDEAPTSVPFTYTDNKAIIVLDEDGDDTALRLGYMWARWVVRRQFASAPGGNLDVARITDLIEDAKRALGRSTTIKRSHTQAKRGIEQAGREVDLLVTEVRDTMEALASELEAEADDG